MYLNPQKFTIFTIKLSIAYGKGVDVKVDCQLQGQEESEADMTAPLVGIIMTDPHKSCFYNTRNSHVQ